MAWKGIRQAIIVKNVKSYNYLFINMPSFFSSEIIGCRGQERSCELGQRMWERERDRQRRMERETERERENGDKFHTARGERVKMNQSSENVLCRLGN